MAIVAANDATFERLVIQNPRALIVEFWAAWAGPCKLVVPELEHLAEKYAGSIDVVTVDVDASPMTSSAFDIQSVPTVAFFEPGREPQGVVGFRPAADYEVAFGLTRWAAAPEAGAGIGTLELIRKLGELRDAGVISSEEFGFKKTALLARI